MCEEEVHPKLVEKVLLTRGEAAQVLGISARAWDRIRKKGKFTEIQVMPGPKGMRFLGMEIEEYIWSHAARP